MFLVKEHPDPGSKDPEEDYPKFGLLDQVLFVMPLQCGQNVFRPLHFFLIVQYSFNVYVYTIDK